MNEKITRIDDLSVIIPSCACPSCGEENDCASDMSGEGRTPGDGDITICMMCGALLCYNANLTIRFLTRAEYEALTPQHLQEVAVMRKAIQHARKLPSFGTAGDRVEGILCVKCDKNDHMWFECGCHCWPDRGRAKAFIFQACERRTLCPVSKFFFKAAEKMGKPMLVVTDENPRGN